MVRYLLLPLLLIHLDGRAAVNEEIIKGLVPRGVVVDQLWQDVTVKTAAGSKIRLEFEHDGSFDEASGVNLGSGDEFEPGGGSLSLHSAARLLTKSGEMLDGHWSFEQDKKHGWVYRFRGKGVKSEARDYVLSAKDGRQLRAD